MDSVVRRVVFMDYVVGIKRVTYYRIESSFDGLRWFDKVNFAQTEQAIAYWMQMVRSGKMPVTQFDLGTVYPDGSTGKWTYTVVVNGFTFRPGSAGLYRRSGEASKAQRDDVSLARRQHKLPELVDR